MALRPNFSGIGLITAHFLLAEQALFGKFKGFKTQFVICMESHYSCEFRYLFFSIFLDEFKI
jgi:hypothetical protein